MTATATTRVRATVLLVITLAIFGVSLAQAPAAEAAPRAATMGATCSAGRIDSTVQVYGGRNQWVATKFFVQKKVGSSWQTVYRTGYSKFRLTFTDPINTSVGMKTKDYAVTIHGAGSYRVWALVWYWDASARQWYGKTWVKPDVYNLFTNGRNTYLSTPYCNFA